MSEYQDYGWTAKPTNAHSYLYDVLVSLLDNKEKNILDVGCGNGDMALRLLNEGYNIYGTDASITGIRVAQQSQPDRFYLQDINSGELPNELRDFYFDTIISTEVIEHLYNPRTYVQFCKQVLMKNGGGELIISCPYHGYLKNLVMALAGKFDNHFTVLWDGGHIKFWSKKTLTQLLEEFGFEVIDFKGAGRFPYLWKSMFIKARIS
jgi:2-polyprenyl-3-methyl-5-hydroxy-6-metoxy-1,4-benzoquinol methylase